MSDILEAELQLFFLPRTGHGHDGKQPMSSSITGIRGEGSLTVPQDSSCQPIFSKFYTPKQYLQRDLLSYQQYEGSMSINTNFRTGLALLLIPVPLCSPQVQQQTPLNPTSQKQQSSCLVISFLFYLLTYLFTYLFIYLSIFSFSAFIPGHCCHRCLCQVPYKHKLASLLSHLFSCTPFLVLSEAVSSNSVRERCKKPCSCQLKIFCTCFRSSVSS